jgi:hypothetical protein
VKLDQESFQGCRSLGVANERYIAAEGSGLVDPRGVGCALTGSRLVVVVERVFRECVG